MSDERFIGKQLVTKLGISNISEKVTDMFRKHLVKCYNMKHEEVERMTNTEVISLMQRLNNWE